MHPNHPGFSGIVLQLNWCIVSESRKLRMLQYGAMISKAHAFCDVDGNHWCNYPIEVAEAF